MNPDICVMIAERDALRVRVSELERAMCQITATGNIDRAHAIAHAALKR